jgi:CRP-like cAMP-binding protein
MSPESLATLCTLQWQSVTARVTEAGMVEKHRVDVPHAHGAHYTVGEADVGFSLLVIVTVHQGTGSPLRCTTPVSPKVERDYSAQTLHPRMCITSAHSIALQHLGDYVQEQQRIFSKSKQTEQLLHATLRAHFLFAKASSSMLDEAVKLMFRVYKRKGEVLIRQGDFAYNMYVVEHGSAGVYVDSQGERQIHSLVGPGHLLGELAVLCPNRPRTASVVAQTEVVMWAISSSTLSSVVDLKEELDPFIRFLKQVALFTHVQPDDLVTLSKHVTKVDVPPGETILREGSPATSIYVVYSGQVKMHGSNGAEDIHLERYKVLGTEAIFEGQNYNRCCVAITEAVVLRLDRAHFQPLLPEMHQLVYERQIAMQV